MEIKRGLRLRILVAGVVAVAGVIGAIACSLEKTAYQVGLPFTPIKLTVESVVERGDYLAAEVVGPDFTLEVFAPKSEECRAVFVAGTKVRYVEIGLRGKFQSGDVECDAVGIGEPQIRLARRPRASGASGTIPRDQATFAETYRDEELRMLRGRFGAAVLLGWDSWSDTIAVIPRDPVCDLLPERGAASMEYRASGTNRLALVTAKGLCRIVGLIMVSGPPAKGGDAVEGEGEAGEARPAG